MGLPIILRVPATIAVGLSVAGGVFATLIGQAAVRIFGRFFGLKTAERRMDVGGYWFRRVMAFCGVTVNPLWRIRVLNKFPFGTDAAKLAEAAKGKGVILMMNHLSNSDPWLTSAVMNPFLSLKWVTKSANATLPIAGGCVRNSGDLQVHFIQKGRFEVHKGTTTPMMDVAKGYIARGMGLAVYPEAIRNLNPNGPLSDFKLGFFSLAVETGAPILTLAITGSERAWPRGTWMFDAATVYMSWGQELIFPQEGETAEALRDRVAAQLSAMRDSHPDRAAYLASIKAKAE